MKTDLHEHVLRVLNTFSEPATIEEITAELVMGEQSCDLGAVPLRAVYNCIEDAIKIGGDSCPILKVMPDNDLAGYILKDKDPDILLGCPPWISIAQKNFEGRPGALTCYGYGWERAKVFWCPRPKILGYQYLTSVNFCEQVGIYMLHTEDGKVEFVGCTTDLALGESLYEHTEDELEQGWAKFSFFGFRPVADDGTLGRLPENVQMLNILHTMVKIIKEIDKPFWSNIYPDYHVSLRFNQLGKPM